MAQFDILNYTETDSHIFFGTRLYMYTFNSGSLYNEFHSWVIDKTTGKSLTFEEVLKVLDVKGESIEIQAISQHEAWGENVVTYHGSFEETKKTQEEALAKGGEHALLVDVGYSVSMLMENDPSKLVIIGSLASSAVGIDDPYTLIPLVEIVDK